MERRKGDEGMEVMKTVALSHVFFSYEPGSENETVIFEDFSFEMPEKDVVAISARSGYGKTTLFRLIAGREKPLSGEISAPSCAVLFQENRLLEHLNCRRQVEVILPAGKTKTAMNYLKMVGLEEEAEKSVSALSGGMQRRLSLARCLAFAKETGKELLLLDEPFAGVDAARAAQIMQEIRTLKIPVLMAAHETTSLELADEVISL